MQKPFLHEDVGGDSWAVKGLGRKGILVQLDSLMLLKLVPNQIKFGWTQRQAILIQLKILFQLIKS